VNTALTQGGVLLGQTGANAAQAANTAAAAGNAAATAAKGFQQASTSSNVLRGAIIGISRVTPVAIFGLGVMGTAAVAAALSIRNALIAASEFEQQLNVFEAVTQATGDEMQRVSDLALELGRDLQLPATSANDAAAAMTELAKAGLSVNQTLAATRGVLQLAAASGVGAAEAARVTAAALNAFALDGDQAVVVADLLAAASIAAQGEITDMANALTQASAVAQQTGTSIQDTITAISLLAKNGLLGSDAGTSLRTTLLRLVPTTKEAAEFTRALGIEFRDAQGALRPLPDIFQQYQEALAELPPTLQQATLQQIFGQDAIRAASILAREGAQGFADMAQEVNRQGAAADLSAAKSQGLAGAVSALNSNLETLGVQLGSVVAGPLTTFISSLATAAGGVTSAVGAIGGAVSAFSNFVSPDPVSPEDFVNADEIVEELRKLQPEIERFQKGLFVPPTVLARIDELRARLEEVGPAGIKAASGIEEARSALNNLAAEAARQRELDPFPDRESQAAASKALVEEVKQNIAGLTQSLTGSLNLLARVGVDAEGTAADTARETALAVVAELKKLGPAGEAAIADLPERLKRVLRAAKVAVAEEAADFEIPIRFQISANLAEISGNLDRQLADVDERIAFLRRKLRTAQREAPGSERVEQISGELAAATAQRRGIISQIEGDARERAQDVQTAIDKADQGVIDILEDGRVRFERAVARARDREGQGGLIPALQALRTRLLAERAQALARIKDAETLRDVLRRLNDDLFDVNQDLIDAREGRDDAIAESFEKRITFAELRAQLTGNDQILVNAINDYIKFLRTVALPAARKARQGVEDVKIEIERLKLQRKELLEDTEGESPDVFVARLFREAADQFRRFGSNINVSATGLLSPQNARGVFAASILGPAGQQSAIAQRTRESQLTEARKQTNLLQVIARGPVRRIQGSRVPTEAQRIVAEIGGDILRGL
jgi:TP901 family phage tail tape measure protein